jgi:hypothetical protein
VEVAASGSHTDHRGPCPAPAGQRPTLVASFTVGRLPAEVRYRWASDGLGDVLDQGWRTLAFDEGGEATREERVPLDLEEAEGPVEGSAWVEVDRPVGAASGPVSVAVVCEPAGRTDDPEQPSPDPDGED